MPDDLFTNETAHKANFPHYWLIRLVPNNKTNQNKTKLGRKLESLHQSRNIMNT
jgi:hypothetical protein